MFESWAEQSGLLNLGDRNFGQSYTEQDTSGGQGLLRAVFLLMTLICYERVAVMLCK
jgi:hypothetical protein